MYILDFEPAGQLEYAELGFKGTVSALTSGAPVGVRIRDAILVFNVL